MEAARWAEQVWEVRPERHLRAGKGVMPGIREETVAAAGGVGCVGRNG